MWHRKLLIASLLLAGGVAGLHAIGAPKKVPATLPDTPAGRRMQECLKAINSRDLGTLRAFTAAYAPSFLERMPAEEHARMGLRIGRDTGGLDPETIERSSDLEVAVIARARLTGDALLIEVAVAPEAPHGITRIGVRPAPPGADARPASGPAEIGRQIDSYVKKLAAADLFSGTVLVAKGGTPFYRRAFGIAHRGYRVPNRIDT